jgi:three-Cys-motif partner protein
MFVGDINEERLEACKARLKALGAPVRGFQGPAEETVKRMVAAVPARALCLAYLDPYNLSLLSFGMIRTLAKLRNIDFAVHFSTMDLIRNVDQELDPERFRFDQVAPGWRDALSEVSKPNLRIEFLRYWISIVGALEFGFSREMPLIRNNNQHEIYRLVFFARHGLPKRLWSDVAKGGTPQLF